MKQLGTLKICGVDYGVFEDSEEEDRGLENAYGYCVSAKQKIVLQCGMEASKFRQILFHEMLHAVMAESGMLTYLDSQIRDKDKSADIEETIVRILSPHLIAALEGVGKLKFK